MFPVNPPVGFGFGHTAKDNGLDSPSHTEGLVVIQKNKKETFKFKMKKKTTIISKLRHNEMDAQDLEKMVEQKVEGKNVTVEVKIPEDAEEGDFALQFYKESESEENNVLNYLLTRNKEDFESTKSEVRKRIRGERARMHLRMALDDDDIGYLERSIATFEKEKLKDTDGDLKKAKQKLAKMKKDRKEKQDVAELKRNLRKAMKERNLDDLEAAIEEAEDSGHPELEHLIEKAKDLAHELEDKELESQQEKYLRNLLKEAIEERKIEGLEEAIKEYNSTWGNRGEEEEEEQPWKKTPRKKKKKESALDREYKKAKELLVMLYEDDAEEAISENDVFGLQTVVDDSERSVLSRELEESEVMERARRYLQQEKRLRRYLSPILALKKSTVAEIYTYRDPMPVTHDVMKATLITLGDQPREISNWKDIQKYLNPSGGILRRIKGFKIDMLRYRSADRAERLLINYTTNDVREASAGVAAFYQWSNNMIEEAKQNGSESDEEEKDRRSEGKEGKKKGGKGSDRRSDNGSKGKGKAPKGGATKKEEKDSAKKKKEKNTAYKGNNRERKKSDNEKDDKGKNDAKRDKDKKEEKTPRKTGRRDESPRREDDKKGDRSSRDEKEKKEEKTPRKTGRRDESPRREDDKKGDKSSRDDKKKKEEKTPRKSRRDESPKREDDKKGDKSSRDQKEKKEEKTPRKTGRRDASPRREDDKKGDKSSRDDKEKTPRKTGKRDESPKRDDKVKKDEKPTKEEKEKAKVDKEKSVHKGNKDDKDDKGRKDDKNKRRPERKDSKSSKDDKDEDDKGKDGRPTTGDRDKKKTTRKR